MPGVYGGHAAPGEQRRGSEGEETTQGLWPRMHPALGPPERLVAPGESHRGTS